MPLAQRNDKLSAYLEIFLTGDADFLAELLNEGKTMTTVAVQDKFIEVLAAFGDVQESVNAALQRYTIEQISTKIAELRRKNAEYQTRYGMDFPAFSQRIAEDEEFVRSVETNINKTWELDLADWEFCHKGVEDWTEKLQSILLT